MKPQNAHLHNLSQAQQKKQQGRLTKHTFKIAIVVKPDGNWLAVGGNEPENDRMAKAIWGTPNGSLPVWAEVSVNLPAHISQPNNNVTSESSMEEAAPFSSSPSGTFVGPGDPQPPIDIEEVTDAPREA